MFDIPSETAFGGDDDVITAIMDGAADKLLTVSKAIDGCGVYAIDTFIEGSVDSADGLLVVRAAPIPTADSPCAEDDRGNTKITGAELP